MKRLAFFSFFLIFAAFACHRKEFKTYEGTYDCIKSIHTWEAGQPNYYENTTGHDITVVKDKKLVKILDLFVHIDSIAPDETYIKHISNTTYQSIRFSNGMLYYLERTSVGGGGFEISYIGKKKEE